MTKTSQGFGHFLLLPLNRRNHIEPSLFPVAQTRVPCCPNQGSVLPKTGFRAAQTETAFQQNNLFWFAIRAKLQCNKHQIRDQNKLFCFSVCYLLFFSLVVAAVRFGTYRDLTQSLPSLLYLPFLFRPHRQMVQTNKSEQILARKKASESVNFPRLFNALFVIHLSLTYCNPHLP